MSKNQKRLQERPKRILCSIKIKDKLFKNYVTVSFRIEIFFKITKRREPNSLSS